MLRDAASMYVVLPSQAVPGPVPTGERALCLALLEDTINVLAGHCGITASAPKHRRPRLLAQLRVDAVAWIEGSTATDALSFATVCGGLGLDADALRGKLLARDATAPPLRLVRSEADGRIGAGRYRARPERSR